MRSLCIRMALQSCSTAVAEFAPGCDEQEEEARRKELDAEASLAEQRFLELQRKAAEAAAAAKEAEAKKKKEQAQVHTPSEYVWITWYKNLGSSKVQWLT